MCFYNIIVHFSTLERYSITGLIYNLLWMYKIKKVPCRGSALPTLQYEEAFLLSQAPNILCDLTIQRPKIGLQKYNFFGFVAGEVIFFSPSPYPIFYYFCSRRRGACEM